jgi:hypothetical protein
MGDSCTRYCRCPDNWRSSRWDSCSRYSGTASPCIQRTPSAVANRSAAKGISRPSGCELWVLHDVILALIDTHVQRNESACPLTRSLKCGELSGCHSGAGPSFAG